MQTNQRWCDNRAPLPSLSEAAKLLGGKIDQGRILCPGPSHSRADRSLSVWLGEDKPEGFSVHSFVDEPLACRDYVRERFNLPPRNERARPRRAAPVRRPEHSRQETSDDQAGRIRAWLAIWNGARAIQGTPAETHLRSRGLDTSEDLSHVLRFSGALRHDGKNVGGMVALLRDVCTNECSGIHRTYLHPDGAPVLEHLADCGKCAPAECRGHKVRKMLGRAKGAAIKVDSNADVTLGLHIGEGIETCLAARQLGYRPVWAVGSAGAIAAFPLLPGIEAITVFAENDDASNRAAEACANRYEEAGLEAWIVEPPTGDMNDLLMRRAA